MLTYFLDINSGGLGSSERSWAISLPTFWVQVASLLSPEPVSALRFPPSSEHG